MNIPTFEPGVRTLRGFGARALSSTCSPSRCSSRCFSAGRRLPKSCWPTYPSSLSMTTPGPRLSVELSPIRSRLEELHHGYRSFHDGEVATYIPELAVANPD